MAEWFWYHIILCYMIVTGALGSVAIAALYLAAFDPPPPPPSHEEQAARFREIMNIR